MATTTSDEPYDDPARTREASRKPSAGRVENLDELAEAFGPILPQPEPAEVEAPPNDRDLTGGAEECQKPAEMPAKEAKPGPPDPALQEAFDAFDGAKLPRPPLTKLTGLTPAEGLEAVRALKEYLDGVGDPVATVLRIVLSELRDQSFESLEETRAFIATVQSILDRAGYAVVCPSCSETGKLDVATRQHLPAGAIRVKHGRMSTHGGGSTITAFELERVEKDPSR
jgi:hypothetical protein